MEILYRSADYPQDGKGRQYERHNEPIWRNGDVPYNYGDHDEGGDVGGKWPCVSHDCQQQR